MPKEKLALLGVPMVPIQIILALMISKYTSGPRPMSMWIKAIPYRCVPIRVITVRKRSCGMVMFLHLSVILFTWGGGCPGPGPGGYPGLGESRPRLGGCPGPGGVQVQAWRQTPPTAADGTHPTGMHSCFLLPLANLSEAWISSSLYVRSGDASFGRSGYRAQNSSI